MTGAQLLNRLPRLGPRWAEETAIAVGVGAPAVRNWRRIGRVPGYKARTLATFMRRRALATGDERWIVAALVWSGPQRKRA